MFKKFKNWLKKKVLKSIVNDIVKDMPKHKELALMFVEQNAEKLLDKIHELIKVEIVKAINK